MQKQTIKDLIAAPFIVAFVLVWLFSLVPAFIADMLGGLWTSKLIWDFLEREKEVVICAAVKTTDGRIIRGHRHHNCLHVIHDMKLHPLREEHGEGQGFITSRNRFVDRKEGLRLQKAAGIPSASPDGYHWQLYSEDLY